MPCARGALAGAEPIDLPNTEKSFDELKARLAGVAYVSASSRLNPDERRSDKGSRALKLGTNERKFTGQALLLNFILPNFYFHCTTAYDILRHCGIELAKRDFMGTPAS